jgi:hypothetical protein
MKCRNSIKAHAITGLLQMIGMNSKVYAADAIKVGEICQ